MLDLLLMRRNVLFIEVNSGVVALDEFACLPFHISNVPDSLVVLFNALIQSFKSLLPLSKPISSAVPYLHRFQSRALLFKGGNEAITNISGVSQPLGNALQLSACLFPDFLKKLHCIETRHLKRERLKAFDTAFYLCQKLL